MMNVQRNHRSIPPPYPELKPNKKIKLKNDMLQWLERNQLGWSPDTCESVGSNFVNKLADVLWTVDGHHGTLKDRGCGVPAMFSAFTNYNQPEKSKHRKRACRNLDHNQVEMCSQTLYQLCGSSYMKRETWKGVWESLLRFADNLQKYASYMERHTQASTSFHNQKAARTDVDEWEVYQVNILLPSKAARYHNLHNALLHAENYEPIFVNDYAPVDRRRRNEYVNQLIFPCKTIRYSYTGQQTHLHFIWKINLTDTETQQQQKNDNNKEKLKREFPVFHSRCMRREFIGHFGRATGVKSGVLREAYKRLTGDASQPDSLSEREVDERIKQVLDDEDPALVWDLRMTNSGRPEEYSEFLKKYQDFVKSKVETAVDDRRHDAVDEDGQSVTHLAVAISARDLHEQVAKECNDLIPIPSLQWLRLQFWPRRASAAAHRGKGSIKIKMMVSARQFRKDHVDAYYASAIFKYQKEFAIKFRDVCTFVCQDDKHTVKIGEPGFPVAAVERGKKVLVGLNQSMQVGDHDFTKFSLSPSVSFVVDIPENIEGSFYDGQVYVGLKENAFEPSSAMRHACELSKLLGDVPDSNPIECHYHDGGPDHNLRYPRTQIVQLAYFLKRDLDQLILVQTPPHHSWKNPAERVMANLNLGLQGVGVMRKPTATLETALKQANNLKAIRVLKQTHPTLEADVKDSVEPVKILLGNCFSRLKLKQKHFKVFCAASKEEMMSIADQVLKIDNDFDPTILLDSSKPCKLSRKLKQFLDKHCIHGHYQFSIKKCNDPDCVCGTPRVEADVFADLHHLPFPIPQREKYKHFEDLYGKENAYNELHVPSKLEKAAQRHTMPFSPSSQKANNVKTVIQCEECLKWRVWYAARVLKHDQKQLLERELDMLSYTCGACFQDILGDDDSIFNVVFVNDKLTYGMPIEAPYYVTFTDPLCFHCGTELELIIDNAHYPICNDCKKSGKAAKGKTLDHLCRSNVPVHFVEV